MEIDTCRRAMMIQQLLAFAAQPGLAFRPNVGRWRQDDGLPCCPSGRHLRQLRQQDQHQLQRPASQRVATLTMVAKKARNYAPRIENRIARMRYEFLETYECGVELVGTEIKAIRLGKMNIRDGYARVNNGQLFLHNVHITPFENASAYFNHEATRVRKLLLHKRDILKLAARQKDTGLTMVPTKAYFNKGGYLKFEIALAKGKQLHDRRQDIKNRDNAREMRAVVKASLSQ
jgi:SsrA-binding protein